MFKETINSWNTTPQDKEDKLKLVKEIHRDLMDVKYISSLLENSIIDCIEVWYDSLIMIINKENDKFKMYINEDDCEEVPMSILCNGNYEQEETNMVCRLLQYYKDVEDFVMFDVGANVGWYSLNAIKHLPQIKLFAFEPSPITYKRLVNNLELNGINRGVACNVGFYKENGKMDFYYDRVRAGASSLVNIQEKDDIDKITVDMVTIDDWVKEHHVERVDFIKCDVEGAELFVYQGGNETIKKYKPIVFSEMLRKWSAKFNYHPNQIIELFASLGYQCFVIENEKLKKFGLVDENTKETNYFFLHREKHAELICALTK